MPRTRFVSIALVAMGAVALAAGAALSLLKVHHTIGTGSLAIGVVLELAGVGMAIRGRTSGLAQRAKGLPRWTAGQRLQSLIVALIIVGATVGSYLYVSSQLSAQSGSQLGLSLNVASANEITYPNGNVGVNVQVSAVGGVPPYSFTAVWGDNSSQTSPDGNFTRVFGAAPQLSTTLRITAESANKRFGSLVLSLPSQVPEAGGFVTTRTLSIVSSNSAQGLPPGSAGASTKTTTTVSGGASSSAVSSTTSTTTSSVSNATSPLGGFEVTVTVFSSSGQPIEGATVTLDGVTSLSTSASGTAVFDGLSAGPHSFVVVYGSFSIRIPYVAAEGAQTNISVTVSSQ